MGRIPSTLPSCLLVHTALHTQPSPVLGAFPASACFHSEALPLAVHMLPSGSRFFSFSAARPARKGLSQGRRLARAGRGAGIPERGRAGLGGRRRAHRRPSERPAAGPAEAGPHGVPPPVPGISAAEKPGSSGRQKEVLGDPRLRPDPAPGQRTWGTAGLCLGHRSLQFSGRRAFPASEHRGTSSQPAQLPAFHLGPAERPADLGEGNSGQGAPPRGRPLGRGDLSLCPPAAWRGWRLRLSEGNRVQDFPSWTSGLRGARCTRVWKSGGSPPPLTPS